MQYTSEELAIRLWDTEHIRHTMNRMCYYLSNRDFRGLINDLWVQKNKRTASLGYNNGYYIGMDEIVRHLVLEQADLPKTGSARMETLTEIFARVPILRSGRRNHGDLPDAGHVLCRPH